MKTTVLGHNYECDIIVFDVKNVLARLYTVYVGYSTLPIIYLGSGCQI